jgi:hypothetical protein
MLKHLLKMHEATSSIPSIRNKAKQKQFGELQIFLEILIKNPKKCPK